MHGSPIAPIRPNGMVSKAVYTLTILPDMPVRVGLPVYTLRRVRPVHSDHILMCLQWMRTVRVGLALQCECSSGRVG